MTPEESAVTDHLTGIANARSLSAHLKREFARANREDSTIGLLVCDLDGFKQVNDRFGHLKGNEVLQAVARNFALLEAQQVGITHTGDPETAVVRLIHRAHVVPARNHLMQGVMGEHAVPKNAKAAAILADLPAALTAIDELSAGLAPVASN